MWMNGFIGSTPICFDHTSEPDSCRIPVGGVEGKLLRLPHELQRLLVSPKPTGVR